MARKSTNNTMNGILNYEENREAAQRKFPHMPVGEAVDMGFDDNGVPTRKCYGWSPVIVINGISMDIITSKSRIVWC